MLIIANQLANLQKLIIMLSHDYLRRDLGWPSNHMDKGSSTQLFMYNTRLILLYILIQIIKKITVILSKVIYCKMLF